MFGDLLRGLFEDKPSKRDGRCPTCRGSGTRSYLVSSFPVTYGQEPCLRCGGTGRR